MGYSVDEFFETPTKSRVLIGRFGIRNMRMCVEHLKILNLRALETNLNKLRTHFTGGIMVPRKHIVT